MQRETLRAFARRATSRELLLLLESELLARATLGLAAATLVLLGTLVACSTLRVEAPLGDELRIAALALAAAAVLAAMAVAVHRAIARRPGPLRSMMRVDPSGELAAALELAEGTALARLAVLRATERAAAIDLDQALPRSTPREATAAPVLALSAGALAFLLATRAAPLPGLSLGPGARETTRRAEETRAVHETAKLLATRARDLARTEDGREAALELARAAKELEAGSTLKAALARLARSRGQLEAARSPGLADALDRAAASLAQSPALRDVARALDQASPPQVAAKGAELAKKLREGALDEEARSEARSAAARAAQALSGAGGAEDAKAKLEQLASQLDQGSKEAQAEAAEKASQALSQASARARKDESRDQASKALEDARNTLAQGGQKKTEGEGSPSPGEGKKGEKKGRETPGGGDARDGEKRRTPNQQAGGEGPRVAGKGGKNETEAATDEKGAEPGSRTASLRGLVGERGASAILAAEGFARGDGGPRARAVLKDYERAEEEALEREPLPLDRRALVRRYFEALAAPREK